MLRLLVVVFLLACAYYGLLWTAQRRVMFPAPPPVDVPAPPDTRFLTIEVDGGQVEAWYLPPRVAGAGGGRMRPAVQTPHPALIFAHGNAELIDWQPPFFDEPRRWGVGVLLVEYPGYGRSYGAPSERTVTQAVVGAYDRLLEMRSVDPTRIVAYGRSLGGGAACALAARRPLAALILQSTFRSARHMARRLLAPGFLVRDPFDNLSVLEAFEGPVLLIHGSRDGTVPIAEGRALHAATPDSRLLVLECGHNDCPPSVPAFWRAVHDFLQAEGVLRASATRN